MHVYRVALFITKKDISVTKKLPKEALLRKEFIRKHNFSVNINPSTKEAEMEITEK